MVAGAQFSRPVRKPDGAMSDTDSIEAASRRLTLALEAWDEAAERRREADRGVEALANQVHALDNDRSGLAGELDQAAARTRALETANREVAQRIDRTIETIRGVLEPGGLARRRAAVEKSLRWGRGNVPGQRHHQRPAV